MKRQNDKWGELFDWQESNEEFDVPLELVSEEGEDGILFPEEAHEAIKRLEQRTKKRGRLMKQPRRAESWQ